MTDPFRGAGIFGFGTLLPWCLIERKWDHNNKQSNYTHTSISLGHTISGSPINELIDSDSEEPISQQVRHLSPAQMIKEQLMPNRTSTPRYLDSDNSAFSSSFGFNSPTRISSSNNVMDLDKTIRQTDTFQEFKETAEPSNSNFCFTEELMAKIVEKAEIGRVIMGMNDI